jgi:hypothetical protein
MPFCRAIASGTSIEGSETQRSSSQNTTQNSNQNFIRFANGLLNETNALVGTYERHSSGLFICMISWCSFYNGEIARDKNYPGTDEQCAGEEEHLS